VLDRYDLRGRVPATVRDHLEGGERGEEPESPGPGDEAFERVQAEIVGNNVLAAKAAAAEAKRRGYNTKILTTTLTGEAREVGRRLAQRAHQAVKTLRENDPVAPPACLIAAGETTVTVTGKGKGGRNQEVALGAAIALDELLSDPERDQILIASAGTDGIDGPTDAAGALATGTTVRRAEVKGRDARTALANNDAYPFFESIDDLILTGPTGTNVMDLQLMIVGKSLPG
jgi:hydroxypyruvate reductase